MDGIVKAISLKNNSVLISCQNVDEWYQLGEKVKGEFVKKGECEFTADAETVSFIKNTGDKAEKFDKPYKPYQKSETDIASILLSYAKDLVVAGKAETLDLASQVVFKVYTDLKNKSTEA